MCAQRKSRGSVFPGGQRERTNHAACDDRKNCADPPCAKIQVRLIIFSFSSRLLSCFRTSRRGRVLVISYCLARRTRAKTLMTRPPVKSFDAIVFPWPIGVRTPLDVLDYVCLLFCFVVGEGCFFSRQKQQQEKTQQQRNNTTAVLGTARYCAAVLLYHDIK